MQGTTLAFLIVAVVFLGGGLLRLLEKILVSRRHPSNSDLQKQFEQLESQTIKSLEQRIQVLEKIVTDEKYDLNRSFKELNKTSTD
ncbi:hypothetical protein [Echinimonas agarilytica]|uniref:Phage shock protein B n=1 Tax=Echinimonas agarilytica TaxID=1215918 RepID=A0AA42B709_9GAMM|nr:hypothetical protein [Echinimonas agarilytica]MCM2679330.1 hypothetical protein [Echinimonas agarilytica]